jgi:poly(3-hydroxyalkanoate) synthetase
MTDGTWATATRGRGHAQWRERARLREGSWWPDRTQWLARRSGRLAPAAPGDDVREGRP